MSELKAKGVDDVYIEYYETGNHDIAQVYIKNEVDLYIKELKKEIERCQRYHDAEAVKWLAVTAKTETENHKLKRALWLMTAEWAEAMGLASCNIANKFTSRENFEVGDDYRNNTFKKYRHRQVVFYKYADYCRRKAEKYK